MVLAPCCFLFFRENDFPNTEGTMLNTYTGLFVLVTLPIAILQTIKEKNRASFLLLFISYPFPHDLLWPGITNTKCAEHFTRFFLLPYSSIIRFYSIFFIIIYSGLALRNLTWENIFEINTDSYSRILKLCFLILSCLCLVAILFHLDAAKTISLTSLTQTIKSISFPEAVLINASIQLLLLGAIFYSAFAKRYQLTNLFFTADLIINTLLCTPYFVVSSYSLSQVNTILHSDKGFPLQSEKINQVAATYIDKKLNNWNNVNIFHKQVSAMSRIGGPLELKNFLYSTDESVITKQAFNHQIIFAGNDSTSGNDQLKLVIQRPTHIRAQVNFANSTTITVMQNYFPGWSAYYNNKHFEFINSDKPGLTITIPKGRNFRFCLQKKNNMDRSFINAPSYH
jgi:hypothetical protein